ncbi:hypothetical protein ACP4OV_026779 [Aristida adscensionis]
MMSTTYLPFHSIPLSPAWYSLAVFSRLPARAHSGNLARRQPPSSGATGVAIAILVTVSYLGSRLQST